MRRSNKDAVSVNEELDWCARADALALEVARDMDRRSTTTGKWARFANGASSLPPSQRIKGVVTLLQTDADPRLAETAERILDTAMAELDARIASQRGESKRASLRRRVVAGISRRGTSTPAGRAIADAAAELRAGRPAARPFRPEARAARPCWAPVKRSDQRYDSHDGVLLDTDGRRCDGPGKPCVGEPITHAEAKRRGLF